MPINRVLYNAQGLYVGPAPATGYHFISSSGTLDNNFKSSTNYNLVRPISRIQSVSYGINVPRTEIKAMGVRGNLNLPAISYPEVSLNFSYLQAGVVNELRMGFYSNYHQTYGISSGRPFYSDNFKVCCISGFITKEVGYSSDVDVSFPYTYRDKRNIFVAINQSGYDVNSQSSNTTVPHYNLDVLGFGNCYINSYSARGGVGQLPLVDVSYIAENLIFYSSGSGIEIPAIDSKYLNHYTGVYCKIPTSYEGDSNVSVLLPGDTTLSISAYPFRQLNAIAGTGINGRANLIARSEDFTLWTSSNAELVATGNVTTNPVTNEMTADILSARSGVITSRSVSQVVNQLQSGQAYEYSLWAKAVNTGILSMGLWDFLKNGWITLNTMNLNNGTSSHAGFGNLPDSSFVQSGIDGWFRCGFTFTSLSGMDSRAYIYPGAFTSSAEAKIYVWGAQIRNTTNPPEYIQTSEQPITGIFVESNPSDLGINFANLNVQNYQIDMNLNRQSLVSLTHKLPLDRKVTFPVYVNSNFSVLCNDITSGQLRNLWYKDKDYFLTFKLKNPHPKQGIGVQYDFRRAKLTNLNFSNAIGDNKIATLSFTNQINPEDYDEGFFISGMMNVEDLTTFNGLLAIDGGADDGFYLLQEDGSRIIVESQNFLY
jgi:hypothetical protein